MVLDTNILIRILTNDNPTLAAKAVSKIRQAKAVLITSVVIAEVIYVLENLYGYERSDLYVVLRFIKSQEKFQVEDLNILEFSFSLYTDFKIDFVDSFIIAKAILSGMEVGTLDKKLEKVYDRLKNNRK